MQFCSISQLARRSCSSASDRSAASMGVPRACVVVFCAMVFLQSCSADMLAGFGNYTATYYPQNLNVSSLTGEVAMTMTNVSGGANGAAMLGMTSYKYGSFSVRMKLINGQQDSSGIVAAFYLTSPRTELTTSGVIDPAWDEIDFEFLGNRSGQPMLLHTNLFVDGVGQREQRIEFWFDPTTDYHTYSCIWNHDVVVWLVDDIPTRVHFNAKNPTNGVQNVFPTRAMVGAASFFEASQWATLGGGIPINPAAQPWTVYYKGFDFQACVVVNENTAPCEQGYQATWWESNWSVLSSSQKSLVSWVRKFYLVSDYCWPSWYAYNATQSLDECNTNVALLG